jgi:hypothetical protein
LGFANLIRCRLSWITISFCSLLTRQRLLPGAGHAPQAGKGPPGATVTVTKNEILYSLNKPKDFILAIVEFLPGDAHRVHYVRRPFQREPDFGVTSVNYDFAELLARADQLS